LITSGKPVNTAKTLAGSDFSLVHKDRITLDFPNCIPNAARAPKKVNLDDFTLSAAEPAPAVVIMEIAAIPFSQYNQAAYQATSGIIDIPIPAGMAKSLATMDIKLSSVRGDMNLNEAVLRVTP
jgi:hypothetical protein